MEKDVIILQSQEKIKRKHIFYFITHVCMPSNKIAVCLKPALPQSLWIHVFLPPVVWMTFFPWGPSRTVLVSWFTCLLACLFFFFMNSSVPTSVWNTMTFLLTVASNYAKKLIGRVCQAKAYHVIFLFVWSRDIVKIQLLQQEPPLSIRSN